MPARRGRWRHRRGLAPSSGSAWPQPGFAAGSAEQRWSVALGHQKQPPGNCAPSPGGTPCTGLALACQLQAGRQLAGQEAAECGSGLCCWGRRCPWGGGSVASRGARGARRWHPRPGNAIPSYLTWAEARSWELSLRSLARTEPPWRCSCASWGSLSTLPISAWCLWMQAATSCGGRGDRAVTWALTGQLLGWHPGGEGQAKGPGPWPGVPGWDKLHPVLGTAGVEASAPAPHLCPCQLLGATQLLDAALQQLRRLPQCGHEGVQLLPGETQQVSGAGGRRAACLEEEEEEEWCQGIPWGAGLRPRRKEHGEGWAGGVCSALFEAFPPPPLGSPDAFPMLFQG